MTKVKGLKAPSPKKAKLITDNGFYQFIPIAQVYYQIIMPIHRRIQLTDAQIDHSENWYFNLTFSLERVTKSFAEYRLINTIKVEAPKATNHQ